MAQWSDKRQQEKAQERLKAVEHALTVHLIERSELFKKFRAGGWQVSVLKPSHTVGQEKMPDNWPVENCHFLVKMPGAYPGRVTTMDQLRRMVKGV